MYALIFVKPLRNSNIETIKEVITREYGAFCGTVTSVLSLFSIIINIVAQITSANALLTASFGISLEFSTLLTVVIIISYITFGGVKATGVLGNVKLVLIYMAIIFGVYRIWNLSDGFLLIHSALPKEIYFNMFSRGFGVDIGSLIAVVLGVICGQTYLQIILSGKTNKHAFNATIISSLLLPPVGLGSVWIGMYMKTKYPFIESSQAFPLFVINNMLQLLGGVILATLLLALVGTASGMALGLGTIMTKDIFNKYINIKSKIFNELSLNRIFIVISIISSSLISSSNYQSSILRWGYLATGFRGGPCYIQC